MLEKVYLGPRGLRSGWRLVFFFLLAALAYLVLGTLLLGSIRPPQAGQPFTPRLVLEGDGLTLFCLLLAAWIMSRLEGKTFRDYGLPVRGAFGIRFWLGVVLGLAALTVLLIAIRLGQGFYFGRLALGARGIFYYGIMWAVGFIVVGLTEEFLFRGYALATLAEGIGFWPAAILLSIGFGAIHLLNPGENHVGALSVAATGLVFCFILRRTGSLWFAVGVHAGWDYAESFVYSVPDSGLLARGHLLNSFFPRNAPVWITGGSVGPEASVFAFIILGVLCWIVHRMFPTAQFPPVGLTQLSPPVPVTDTPLALQGGHDGTENRQD